MEASFWHQRWHENRIGFHEGAPNSLLVEHLEALGLEKGARIFVPLCGKTHDLHWLASQGFKVVGAELSQLAVEQFFSEANLVPSQTVVANFKHYSCANIEIFVGDIFELTQSLLGSVEAIYDRAALVALPPQMRGGYGTHLRAITRKAPQLLISFEYDQSQMNGPPFSIGKNDVGLYYQNHYQIQLAESREVEGGLKGKCAATEHVWLLT